jgi:tRNA dimethylallyltransferase
LANGLIEEVEELLKNNFPAEQLILLGLEYKFITEYLIGQIDKKEMLVKLEIAIHQFAKRQCTWFRKMEKEGFHIHWIDGTDRLENQIQKALLFIHNNFAFLNK